MPKDSKKLSTEYAYATHIYHQKNDNLTVSFRMKCWKSSAVPTVASSYVGGDGATMACSQEEPSVDLLASESFLEKTKKKTLNLIL